MSYIVIGMTDRIKLLRRTPDSVQVGKNGRNVHIFVQRIEKVASELPGGEKWTDWDLKGSREGFRTNPELCQHNLYRMDTPPSTEIMTDLEIIAEVAGERTRMADMLNNRQKVVKSDLCEVIDRYEDVKYYVHISICMEWVNFQRPRMPKTCIGQWRYSN